MGTLKKSFPGLSRGWGVKKEGNRNMPRGVVHLGEITKRKKNKRGKSWKTLKERRPAGNAATLM